MARSAGGVGDRDSSESGEDIGDAEPSSAGGEGGIDGGIDSGMDSGIASGIDSGIDGGIDGGIEGGSSIVATVVSAEEGGGGAEPKNWETWLKTGVTTLEEIAARKRAGEANESGAWPAVFWSEWEVGEGGRWGCDEGERAREL